MLPENDTFYVNPLDGEVFANVINTSTGYKVTEYRGWLKSLNTLSHVKLLEGLIIMTILVALMLKTF